MHTKKPSKYWKLLLGMWGVKKNFLVFYKAMHPRHKKRADENSNQ